MKLRSILIALWLALVPAAFAAPITDLASNALTGGTATDRFAAGETYILAAPNVAPTLVATAGSPAYSGGGPVFGIFSGTTAGFGGSDSGQTFSQFTFTISNLADGANELLNIDSTAYALGSSNTSTSLGALGVSVAVVVSSGTATVTVSKTGLTAANIATLINGLGYANTATTRTNATGRTYTLTSIKDSGGTAGGGVDTTTVSIASTVTIVNAPTVTSPTSASVASNSATLGGNVTDAGGGTITARGVVVSLTSLNNNPQIGGGNVTNVTGTGTTGVFTVSATGLTATSGYSYAAYATNAAGTTYSSVGTFTTATPDVTPPTVANVTASTADGSYKAGAAVSIQVTFSEIVTVTGTPQLTLETGTTDRTATYTSGSGTDTLTFTYTIQAGDTAADLDYVSTSALALNGGTIADLAANPATLTIAAPGAAGSLGANKAIVVDTTAPTLSAVTIASSNANTARAKTGDVVTLAFTASETIGAPTVTIAGNTVTATNPTGNNWTAAYTATGTDAEGTIAFSIAFADTATNAGTTVTATTNASVVTFDRTLPTVTAANISLSGATGTGGAFKIGDTVTATWNNTGTGDNNPDIDTVTILFSFFGGSGATATNNAGTWSATYTLVAGSIDATNRNVSVTARDTTGNSTTRLGTTNATVDNIAPTVTAAKISLSGATGTGGVFKTGDTVTATWDNTVATGDNNTDTISSVAVNFSAFGGGSAVTATETSRSWSATYTIVAGAIEASNLNVIFTATDNAGNATARTGTNNATVDNVAPAAPSAPDLVAASDSGSSSTDNLTTLTTPTLTGTAAVGVTVRLYDTDGTTLLGTTTADGSGNWSITSSALSSGAHTLTAKAMDAVGNISGASTSLVVTVDTTRPTLASAITISDTALKIGDTATVTFTFTKAVTGFTTADLTAPSAALSNLTSSDGGITWTATLTPNASTTAASNVLTLDYTGIADLAGNAGTGSATSGNYSVDTVRPVLASAITISDTALKIGDTATVTFTYTEAVTGFTIADVTAPNGVLSNLTTSDGGITWTATLTPSASTTAASNVLTLDYTGVADLAGNAGTGSATSGNYAVDTVRPVLASAITISDTALKIGDTATVTFTYTEAVTGFTIADVTAPNGTLSNLTSGDGGITWTATLTPNASTTAASNVLTLDYTGVADLAGNAGTGSATSGNYAVDTVRPTATLVVATTSLKVGATSAVTVTFSEAVTGFTTADVTAPNATLSNLSSSDGGITWTATLTPSATTTATTNVLTLDNTGVTDVAGNAGSGTTTSNNYAIDTVPPTLTSVAIASNNANPIWAKTGDTVTVTFTTSEAVATPTATVAGHTATIANTSGNTYTATTTMLVGDTEGVVSFSVSFTDTTGNAGTAVTATTNASAVTFDRTAPTAPAITAITTDTGASSTDFITSDPTLVLSGTAEANSTVTVSRLGTGVLGTATANGTGAWSYDYTGTTLSAGDHSFTATATDAAGNASSASTALIVTVDTATAAPVIASITNDTGASATDGITSDTTLTLSGTAEANSTVTLTRSASPTPLTLGTATANGTGAWSFVYATALADGSYLFNASAVDLAGNTSAASADFPVVIDTAAPVAPVIAAITTDTGTSTTDRITNDPTLVLSGTAEANSTVTVSRTGTGVLGTATANGTGAWSYDYSATTLPEGTHTFTATATDAAGNVSPASANFAVTVDTTVPTLTAVTIASNNATTTLAKIGNTVTVTFTASEAIVTPTATLAGRAATIALVTGNTYTASVVLAAGDPEGTAAFSLAYTDIAGNAGTAVTTTTNASAVTIDTTVPTLTAVAIVSNNATTSRAKVGDTVTVTFTASEAIATPTATIAGRTATIVNTSGNTYTAALALAAGDPEGTVAFALSFADLAGNAGVTVTATTNASAVNFDRTPPTLTSVAIVSNNANPIWAKVGDVVTVSFTASEAIATPSATIAGHIATIANVSGNNYTATTTMLTGDTEGTVVFALSFVDVTGNAGTTVTATTNSSAVTFDKTPPVITSPITASTTYKSAFTYPIVATGSAVTYGATGLPAGLTLTGSTIGGAATTNGSFTIALTATDAAGNTGTANLDLTIAKVNLTVAGITASSRIYDATTVAALNTASAALVGVVSGDTVTLVKSAAAGAFATKVIGAAKTVQISGLTLAVDATSANYTLTQPTTTADITAKNLTVTGITAANKVYDGNSVAALTTTGATLVGVVVATPAEAVTLVTAAATGAFANANAGFTKTVQVSGLTLSGADAGNYTVTQPTTTATISPANVTIAFSGLSQTYDGTPKSATITASPTVPLSIVYANPGGIAPTNAGSYLVSANVTDTNYSGNGNATLVIAKANQTVAFAAPGVPTIGTPLALSATASSGLPITFSLVSGPATVAGSALTFTGGGSAVVRASQAGNENYLAAAADVTVSSATRAAQTIAFAPLGNKLANDPAFALSATASSGLPVSFTVVSGPATLSGNNLTLTGAPGAVTIRASQAGNAAFFPATDVTQSFNVLAVGHRIFFGLTQNSDNIAIDLAPDGKSGTLLCFLGATGEAYIVTFTVNPDGTFEADVVSLGSALGGADLAAATTGPSTAAAPVTRTFRGLVSGNTITGSIGTLPGGFTTTLQPTAGPSAAISGLYVSSPVNSAGGTTASIVGTQGQVFVVAATANLATGGTGTVSSAGAFTVTAPGATITAAIDAPTTTISGTITVPGQAAVAFNGLSSSTARTDRLINLSSRVRVGPTAGRTLITGFVIGGAAPKRVLLRAVGPALADFGVTGALANPRLQVYDASSRLVLENDDWSGADTAAAMSQVGAFALTPGARDAALLATLAPGAYTMHVIDGGETGVALAEIYDASANPQGEYQRLVNISSRGTVEAGEGVLIGGFIVTGNSPKKMLVRGVGPGLAAFGVAGSLADPRLAIYRGATVVAQNNDWTAPQPLTASQTAASAEELSVAARTTGAFAFAAGSKDAAILITLAPGAYTAQVSAADGTSTGTALVEIYEIP